MFGSVKFPLQPQYSRHLWGPYQVPFPLTKVARECVKGKNEDSCLLGCDALQSFRRVPIFQVSILPPSLVDKVGSMFFDIFGTCIPGHLVS